MKKLRIAILGSGNIGTDLLVKILRSEVLECGLFIGRTFSSPGMIKANSLGVSVSDRSIDAIIGNPDCCDLVFDATSAAAHERHATILAQLGKTVVDLTPSQRGDLCVPAINLHHCDQSQNVNMVTCGGQASIPIAHVITQHQQGVEYIEVVSSIASRSAGPGTRINIDEYIENTEKGLVELTGCKHVKAILILNPAQPHIDMQTTIFAKVTDPNLERLKGPIEEITKTIQAYVPGYNIALGPIYENGRIVVTVRVKGIGDYLPSYAGNLDIITCAAIATAEQFAKKAMRNSYENASEHAY